MYSCTHMHIKFQVSLLLILCLSHNLLFGQRLFTLSSYGQVCMTVLRIFSFLSFTDRWMMLHWVRWFKRKCPQREWHYWEVWPCWSRCGLVGGSVSLWRWALWFFSSFTQCDSQLSSCCFWSRCRQHICLGTAMVPVMMIMDWTSETVICHLN